jgi:hypothetical protein
MGRGGFEDMEVVGEVDSVGHSRIVVVSMNTGKKSVFEFLIYLYSMAQFLLKTGPIKECFPRLLYKALDLKSPSVFQPT